MSTGEILGWAAQIIKAVVDAISEAVKGAEPPALAELQAKVHAAIDARSTDWLSESKRHRPHHCATCSRAVSASAGTASCGGGSIRSVQMTSVRWSAMGVALIRDLSEDSSMILAFCEEPP